MPTAKDYLDLDQKELRERLARAEAACILFAWSSVQGPGMDVVHQAWSEWVEMVGADYLDPDRHPDLNERRLFELATKRADIRNRTIQWLKNDD